MLPNTQAGIEYWQTQPANLDGVLGGYGSGVRNYCPSYSRLLINTCSSHFPGLIPWVPAFFC